MKKTELYAVKPRLASSSPTRNACSTACLKPENQPRKTEKYSTLSQEEEWKGHSERSGQARHQMVHDTLILLAKIYLLRRRRSHDPLDGHSGIRRPVRSSKRPLPRSFSRPRKKGASSGLARWPHGSPSLGRCPPAGHGLPLYRELVDFKCKQLIDNIGK